MKNAIKWICALCAALLLIPSALATDTASKPEEEGMSVTSTAIVDGVLGDAYGKFGAQKRGSMPALSPPLTVVNPPESTVCYAVIMLDPDAKNWVHWLAANIVLDEDGLLPENASVEWADDMVQGKNDFGKTGYGGPTPPSGVHTYTITVYALDAELPLKVNYSLKQLKTAMEEHVLAEAVIMGSYRSKK